MNLIRISESDDFIVDYDKDRGMYRVSVFEDYHFQDEYWFDAYEEKELPAQTIDREWYLIRNKVPPLNEEVELKFIRHEEERIIVDKLLPMMNGTYVWNYGDYSDCEVVAWRKIPKH